MRSELKNKVLTIFFKGELNSFNSEDIEKEIDSIISNNDFKSLIIDMENLNYISSAGLRIIVRLKQKFSDTKLVKVPSGVYDIFDMVGFQNIIEIERL